jgi:hypothetical protein
VERARDEQRHVVDHVAVRDVVHELGERADGVGADVAELGDELLGGLGREAGGGRVGRQGGEEVAVGRAELEFEVCRPTVRG